MGGPRHLSQKNSNSPAHLSPLKNVPSLSKTKFHDHSYIIASHATFFVSIKTVFVNCGRARARPQTNLAFGGQRHVLKAYSARADLRENFGTFLAFLCSSNWNEWYVNKRRSKGPGVEFKLCDMGHVFHVNISKCSFPTHMHGQCLLVQARKLSFHLKSVIFMALYPRQNSRFAFDVQVYHLTMRHLSFIIQHCCLRCDIGVSK